MAMSTYGLQGLTGGLGQAGGLADMQQRQNDAFRAMADDSRIRHGIFYGDSGPKVKKGPKTIREELQEEITEWVKDVY